MCLGNGGTAQTDHGAERQNSLCSNVRDRPAVFLAVERGHPTALCIKLQLTGGGEPTIYCQGRVEL